jgi:hypothetical protein
MTKALSVPAVPPVLVKLKVKESSAVVLDDLAIVVAASNVMASEMASKSMVSAVISASTMAEYDGAVPPCNIVVVVPAPV